MKFYKYFLILFLCKSSICLSSAQNSQPLTTKILYESSFTRRHSETNQPLEPLSDPTLEKIITAAIQRKNETQIVIRSDKVDRVALLQIEIENFKEKTISLQKHCVKLSNDDESLATQSLWDLARKATHTHQEINPFTTANISQILLDNQRTLTPDNKPILTPELSARLTNILHCTTSGRLLFVSRCQIASIAQQAKEKDNSFLSNNYPDLDPRALEDIEKKMQQTTKSEPILLTQKKESAKPSNSCFKQ